MTPDCVEEVHMLEYLDTCAVGDGIRFDELSVEQLLYAAIKEVGVSDVRFVLEHTNWSKWIELGKEGWGGS